MGEGDHAFVVAGQRADGRTGKATLALFAFVSALAALPRLGDEHPSFAGAGAGVILQCDERASVERHHVETSIFCI